MPVRTHETIATEMSPALIMYEALNKLDRLHRQSFAFQMNIVHPDISADVKRNHRRQIRDIELRITDIKIEIQHYSNSFRIGDMLTIVMQHRQGLPLPPHLL